MRPIKEWKSKLKLTAFYAVTVGIFWLLDAKCILQSLFHIPCPGCGMSRAFFSALQLDLHAAFFFHPMFWSIPILYLYFLYDGSVFRKKWLDRGILIGIGTGFLLNWIISLFCMSNI